VFQVLRNPIVNVAAQLNKVIPAFVSSACKFVDSGEQSGIIVLSQASSLKKSTFATSLDVVWLCG
jgi:hypothetical protein